MSASPTLQSLSDEHPQKRLRKGTHSCTECRRRKKSCVPRAATPGSCEECYARGVECRNQEVSLGTKRRAQVGKHDLQQRVTELETALLSISQKLETTPGVIHHDNGAVESLQQPHSEISTTVASPESSADAFLKHAPVLSLFDNAILSRQPEEIAKQDSYDTGSLRPEATASTPRLDKIRQDLLSLFPPQQRQEALLNASHTWWSCWQDLYPQIFGLGAFEDVFQFFADLRTSESVQKVVKALLFLFIILQEGSTGLTTVNDMKNLNVKTSQALSIMDELVLNDDELAGTVDGVECIYLRAKYELNCGRVRKAWLTFRRGISFAQISGFHKCLTDSVNEASQSLRRESLWKGLYSADRYLSLMLGLPYGPSEIHSNVGRDSEACAKGIQVQDAREHYFYRLANIVGHIIDRDQQLPSNNMLLLTFKIEAEMTELADSMTKDWWDFEGGPRPLLKRMYNQLLPQFCHHQARSFLHLPFMLKASTDHRFEYNKIAALDSAREMIARYRIIRPAQGFGSLVCKMIDFQIFTAAMILVLNLLEHYGKAETHDNSEADNDQDLISEITEILQRASAETDGGAATQAARALENFGNIKERFSKPAEECSGATKVVIPYFGTVTIVPGTSLKVHVQTQKPEWLPQLQQLPTPSDQSLDGSTPNSAPANNPVMETTMPLDASHGGDIQDLGVNSDFMANVNFDLEQGWNWFWNNTDIPLEGYEGTAA